MRVFFDASVIIAAILSETGGSSLLFKYVKKNKIIGITSQTAVDEILEKDKSKRIKKSRKEIKEFIANSGLIVREQIKLEAIELYQSQVDLEDAHLIAGSKLTKCSYLVTLDKFLPLQIVSPKELLEKILLLVTR